MMDMAQHNQALRAQLPYPIPILASNPSQWPKEFQDAYQELLIAKQFAEMRYLLWVGITLSLVCIPAYFIIIPEHAIWTVLAIVLVVLPIQITAMLLPVRQLRLQKLLSGLAPVALSGRC